MIDDHLYQQARRRMFSSWLGDIRVVVAVGGGVLLLATQIVALVFLFAH